MHDVLLRFAEIFNSSPSRRFCRNLDCAEILTELFMIINILFLLNQSSILWQEFCGDLNYTSRTSSHERGTQKALL